VWSLALQVLAGRWAGGRASGQAGRQADREAKIEFWNFFYGYQCSLDK